MLLIHGVYQFAKKRIAYRNDYCLNCQDINIAEQYSTFDAVHIFFIPLIPLGIKKRWYCTRCGIDPHARTRTSRALMIVFAVVLALITVIFWAPLFLGDKSMPNDAMIWSLRIGFPAGLVGLIFWLKNDANRKPDVQLQEGLDTVPPLSGDVCLYCSGPLDNKDFCAKCQLQRTRVMNRILA